MRIIVIGGAGTIGKAAVAALSDRHEVVVAGRQSGAVQVDIQSPDSVQAIYREIGSFDALVCTAGEAYFDPFDTMSEADLVLGIESKLLGQIRLVLLGQSLISDGGSFTLISGYVLDDPIPVASSFAVANGGVEGFVRAAALNLGRGVRINAVSPAWLKTVTNSSLASTRGVSLSPCARSAPPLRSVEGWRTGEIIRAW